LPGETRLYLKLKGFQLLLGYKDLLMVASCQGEKPLYSIGFSLKTDKTLMVDISNKENKKRQITFVFTSGFIYLSP
jgi:hypothetical protein